MNKLLIISPYFPPTNSADMQRIRMSLPYFNNFGWEASVATVHPQHSNLVKDELLIEAVPKNIRIINIDAFSTKWTRKLGFGSLALRSMLYYKHSIDKLLANEKFDLIYFSTTEFPLLILGRHWKRKFGIPFVIDMQDPWHSDYYQNKPRQERPRKHWFSYRLNKWLEPKAMQMVDGLISVSQGYLDALCSRYPRLITVPQRVITFSAFEPDIKVMQKHANTFVLPFQKLAKNYHFVYVGRGGHDLQLSARLLFDGFKKGLEEAPELFTKVRFHFLGTSYAPKGQGKPTVLPVASEFGLTNYVEEQTDRLPYYQTLYTLSNADHLVILGSDDPHYTASKVFPYLLSKIPILAFFHSKSSAAQIIEKCGAGKVIPIDSHGDTLKDLVYQYLHDLLRAQMPSHSINWKAFEPYLAPEMCKQQCIIFTDVIRQFNNA